MCVCGTNSNSSRRAGLVVNPLDIYCKRLSGFLGGWVCAVPRAGPLSTGSSPKQLPISQSGPRHWYFLNFRRCPSWSAGPRAPGFRGAGVPIFLSASALASRLRHASMPQSPAARWEIQNAEAIVMRMSASYRSIESPCGRYCHLLVVTSCLLMEVTQSFQIVCRTHWPSPRGHQLLPP